MSKYILMIFLVGCNPIDLSSLPDLDPAVESGYHNSLPGNWRPFSGSSPWNIVISNTSTGVGRSYDTHINNDLIMSLMTRTPNIRFGNSYLPPLWVVEDYNSFEQHYFYSAKIFDPFDCCPKDSISDTPLPIVRETYEEPTSDGHIIVYDRINERFFECSRFDWPNPGEPEGTTFNIWSNLGAGYGVANSSHRWQLQGGRGSGVPIIAGLIRPEEIQAGEIRHALAFTFNDNRKGDDGENVFISPPASRSDGKRVGEKYPIEGMRFQLNPDWDDSSLMAPTKIISDALKNYGAFLVDNGGDFAVQLQLLGETPEEHRDRWDELFPGLYQDIQNIPTSEFRVLDIGEEVHFE